jgi:hypothetical protein
MGTESFDYVKPSLSSAPNVQLVGQMYGQLVGTVQRTNAGGDSIQLAGLFSTAPYTGPGAEQSRPLRQSKPGQPDVRRVSDGARIVNGKPRCRANEDTCMGIAFNNPYCLGHRRAQEKEARSSTSRD